MWLPESEEVKKGSGLSTATLKESRRHISVSGDHGTGSFDEESGVQQDSAQEAHGWPIEWHSRDLCHPQVGLLSSYGVLGGRGEFQWDPVTELLQII